MSDLTTLFGGALTLTENNSQNPTQQLESAMLKEGFSPSLISLDGELHRFGAKNNCWYVAYGDGIPAGIFGDWSTGIEFTWHAKTGKKLTMMEVATKAERMKKLKAVRKAQKDVKHKNTAVAVTTIFNSLPLANPSHAYLQHKQINGVSLRQSGENLVAPLYNIDGVLTSLQYITPTGDKRFQKDGECKGSFNVIGKIAPTTKKIFIAEGHATAETIYQETSIPTVATYSAGNIPTVTELFRTRYGNIDITIVADNDSLKKDTGKKYADKAASLYGAKVIVPPIPGDANDYKLAGNDLLTLLIPPTPWLVSVKDFTASPMPIKWLIKNWIQAESMIMMFGSSGCGKTFTIVDMALRIATPSCDTWHSEIVRHGDVAYLAGEGHAGLRARCKAWIQHNQKENDDIRFFISQSGTDLNTPTGLQKTINALNEMAIIPRIIVVDTLHRFLDGDENSAQDSKTMLDACAELTREFNCSVLLVHHTGVNGEAQKRGRGSSSWKGALEQEIMVEKEEGTPFIKLTQTKNKDAEAAMPKSLELATIDLKGWFDEDGEQVSSAIVIPSENRSNKKENSKLKEFVNLFKKAWYATECEVQKDSPYVTRAALRNKLKEFKDLNDRTVTNYLTPSRKGSMIAELLDANMVENCQNGWIVIDNLERSAMMLTR